MVKGRQPALVGPWVFGGVETIHLMSANCPSLQSLVAVIVVVVVVIVAVVVLLLLFLLFLLLPFPPPPLLPFPPPPSLPLPPPTPPYPAPYPSFLFERAIAPEKTYPSSVGVAACTSDMKPYCW